MVNNIEGANALINYNSSNFSSIEECITNSKNNKIEVRNVSLLYKYKDLQIASTNIFDDYLEVLEGISQEYTIPEIFMYKPEYLSYSLYGSPDLWYLILQLNNMGTFYDFNKEVVKAIPPDKLDIVNNIIENNKDKLFVNNNSPEIISDIVYKKI